MTANLNGQGFSEEQQPFEEAVSATTSRRIAFNRDNPFNMNKRQLAESRVVWTQYQAFHAIYALWLRRKAEGMTQKDIADKLERDPAWVSRALGGPKNWTMRTLGELAEALGGYVEVEVTALEDLQAEDNATMSPKR